mgnify:FL=1
MTEPSRFQIPISLDFIKKWNPTKVTPTFEDWATGGIYAPDADLGGRYEEYSHWNWGEQHQLMSFMGGDISAIADGRESHYKNMTDEITGFFLINDQIQNYFDYMRHILYLHNMFVYYDIPHLIVDMLEGMTVCSLIKEELEKITELPENVMLLKFQQNKWELQETTGGEFDKNIGEHYVTWFKYVKKSNMSKKFNKLYNAVISLKEFDGHPYRNYFSKVTRNSPQRSNDMYIGSMPGGHPNEECHTVFAERMYNEIMNRSIL